MAEDDVVANATLLRQHFAKGDAVQMANDLIIKETLGATGTQPQQWVLARARKVRPRNRPISLAPSGTAGQGTYGRVRLAELTDTAKASLMSEQQVLTTGFFALKVRPRGAAVAV